MLQTIYKGKLVKKDGKLFVEDYITSINPTTGTEIKHTRVFPVKDSETFSKEELETFIDKDVMYLVSPSWLADSTIVYAKLVRMTETWDEILERFKKEVKWAQGDLSMFIGFLKEEYRSPTRVKV